MPGILKHLPHRPDCLPCRHNVIVQNHIFLFRFNFHLEIRIDPVPVLSGKRIHIKRNAKLFSCIPAYLSRKMEPLFMPSPRRGHDAPIALRDICPQRLFQIIAKVFSEYLHRIKEWSRGNRADELSEKNIDKFKGVARKDSYPYAQFYKGAFAYLESFNRSPLPFVLGTRKLNTFRIDSPIIAGKPFFEYAEHYFEILKDIQNNDKYKGYFVNNNDIVKTLNLKEYRQGAGNRRTRLLFDSAILLYVDRFCPDQPTKLDIEMLDQFVIFCFIWAYSLRAQYESLHWSSVQNYILGNDKKKNSLNIYKEITEAETPTGLICTLSEKLSPLLLEDIRFQKDKVKESELKTVAKEKEKYENLDEVVYKYFLYYFDKYHFLKKSGNQEDNKRSKEEKIQ